MSLMVNLSSKSILQSKECIIMFAQVITIVKRTEEHNKKQAVKTVSNATKSNQSNSIQFSVLIEPDDIASWNEAKRSISKYKNVVKSNEQIPSWFSIEL